MVTTHPVSEMKEGWEIHADNPPESCLCVYEQAIGQSLPTAPADELCGLDGAARVCVRRTDPSQPRNMPVLIWDGISNLFRSSISSDYLHKSEKVHTLFLQLTEISTTVIIPRY